MHFFRDNFYFAGVTSVDDPRFKATFEEVYVEGYPELSGKDMWRLVAGNRARSASVSLRLATRSSAHPSIRARLSHASSRAAPVSKPAFCR